MERQSASSLEDVRCVLWNCVICFFPNCLGVLFTCPRCFLSCLSPRHSKTRVRESGEDIGADVSISCSSGPVKCWCHYLTNWTTSDNRLWRHSPTKVIVSRETWFSPAQQVTPAGEEGNVSPLQKQAVSSAGAQVISSALLPAPVPKLLKARKLPIRRSAWQVFETYFLVFLTLSLCECFFLPLFFSVSSKASDLGLGLTDSCHTLTFLNFRMWLKLKIKQQFSQHLFFFTENLV
jgi:hypothetical protein